MRALIRWFDGWLSRRNRIFVFSTDDDCLLRLQFAPAPHAMQLNGTHIRRGDTVLAIHLWNDRMPGIPKEGPDFTWAAKTLRRYRYSLHLAARYVKQNPSLPAFRAVLGVTSLFAPPSGEGSSHPMGRFGFIVVPTCNPLGRFGEFWENFYAWLLMWAYNPANARRRELLKTRRSEIWMEAANFLERYGI